MPIFKITFTDNSVFEGGESVYNSLWDQIPDKDISCLEYFIDANESLILKNFEEYTYFVEATQNVYGPKGTDLRSKLKNVYVMGRRGGKVKSYRIALIGSPGSDKYHKGDITRRTISYGKEFRGRRTYNWKKGIRG
jgi:hypothetical protein